MHCPGIFYSRNGFGAIIAIRFYILVCITTYHFTHVLHVCLCVKAVGVFVYKVSCTFLFVDIRINHLSTNHSYAVVGTCSDKEILDALPQSPYSFICFCIAHEDFPELNVEDSEEFSNLYEAVMMDAHNDARNYLNGDLMQIDKRVIIYVQGGTPVIHLFVKWLLPCFSTNATQIITKSVKISMSYQYNKYVIPRTSFFFIIVYMILRHGEELIPTVFR